MSNVVRLTRVFKTDIDTLFDLWTRPEHLKSWHRPHPTLFTTPAAEVDLRIGGKFSITMHGPDGTHIVIGKFTEIDKPKTMALAWRWEGSEEITNVRITMRPVDGGTELTLVHEHPDTSTMPKSHEEGWLACFSVLDTVIEGSKA